MAEASSADADARFDTARPPLVAPWHNPTYRSVAYQVLAIAVLALLLWLIGTNVAANMARNKKTLGFGFLGQTAGFDISQTLIAYSNTSTFGRVFLVGLLNTALVAGIGIVLATLLGFLVGVARLSSNWLVRQLASTYVEVLRNMPLLLQLFFWYFGILQSLPAARQSLHLYLPKPVPEEGLGLVVLAALLALAVAVLLGFWSRRRWLATGRTFPLAWSALGLIVGLPMLAFLAAGRPLHFDHPSEPGGGFLNVRGLYLPKPVPDKGFGLVVLATLLALAVAVVLSAWSRRRQLATGQTFPVGWSAFGLIAGLPLLAFLGLGQPLHFEAPVMQGFNFEGGMVLQPEFMALLLGLVFYTAAYIAEVVRAGIAAVPKGQTEAGRALGLSGGQILSRIVIPQAMRVIIPPLTNQYLNLTKNSTLGVAIGYPDLVSVFAGTVLNLTGQAIEVIFLTMLVYLGLSLATSAAMNWFNQRIKLVER